MTKAGQAHLMRCLAKSQGPKVKYHFTFTIILMSRVNAVLPGLLLSECMLLLCGVDIQGERNMEMK